MGGSINKTDTPQKRKSKGLKVQLKRCPALFIIKDMPTETEGNDHHILIKPAKIHLMNYPGWEANLIHRWLEESFV
jgi:hypothetical protein